ncbi:hypothetical protein [Pseudomonas viridiflava]|uniref:Uncharacterized protein n=1 Tax=Pseudomonas viridiflava TaxID=33069 RepID=A0ABU7N7Q8_PSEVI|nr:hypothetical protein [Pseudomonas viridiflava]MEE3936002.1 hypothetical protein [Pseudomonas viridiflava]MEE4040984.1 hypothetical protein [Pseudomonas viridiflava]MEE4061239.1 hypothetical protein [Pseudomonas viridiflava]MEE4169198.1 hypothetical protein [Pseudomonas viridiflava]QXG48061.1 hypothetical protein KTT57_03060 [Pseudomonas viridiflava]
MTKRTFTNKRITTWRNGLLLANAALLIFLLLHNITKGHDMKIIKTKEPLLIESPTGDDNYYVLPTGTSLYREKSFPEGHDRYVIYLNHKGNIAHEDVPMKPEYDGQFIDPLWASNIDADTLKILFNRFPLSKEDVIAAIKSNEITRDDLADIIRSLP